MADDLGRGRARGRGRGAPTELRPMGGMPQEPQVRFFQTKNICQDLGYFKTFFYSI